MNKLSRDEICNICKGRGYLKENGIVHTCWVCLKEGKL